ncbi:Ionotropic receptor 75m [Blattella germanica]|nr:Ionotropic receptor 75m [Blattella germanica]
MSTVLNFRVLKMSQLLHFVHFLVYLVVSTHIVKTNKIITTEFIVDVLKFQAKVSPPARVNTFLCWDFGDLRYLMNYMSQRQVQLAVHTSLDGFLSQLHRADESKHEIFILDIDCEDVELILSEAHNSFKFRPWLRWLLLDTSTYLQNNKSLELIDTKAMEEPDAVDYLLMDTDVLLNSEVTVGKQISENMFTCLEIYKRGKMEPLIKNILGEWNVNEGMKTMAPLVTSRRRTNIHKSLLKAVMVVTVNDTLNHLDNTINKHIDTITKVNDALFHHIVDILNASISMVIVDTWGYPDENNNWSGLAGYLQRSDADIGTTGMFVTKQRLPFVRYIASTSETKNSFIFRQPPLSFVENIFTLPFNRSTWWASAGLITLTGFILYIAFKWEFKKKKITDGASNERERVQGSDVLLMSLGAICQQGTSQEAESIPGRILMFFLFTSVIFLYTAYSACIVALLQSSTNRIRTLKDLLNSGLTLGVEDVVYNHHYFPAATDPVRHAIYTEKVNPPGGPNRFMSLEEGLKRVRKGLFAFHVELGPGYEVISDTFFEEEKCGLETINFLIEIVEPWVGVSKTTPFTEILSVAYRMLKERGLQHRENVRFYQKKPECVSQGSLFVSVGLRDCYSAMVVLLYGILFAISTLILEILYFKWNHHKNKSNENYLSP